MFSQFIIAALTTNNSILCTSVSTFATPNIGTQPRVFVPSINITKFDFFSVGESEYYNMLTKPIIKIELSLNFYRLCENGKIDISERFVLSQTAIALIRFRKKHHTDSPYARVIQAPREIFLPSGKNSKFGFKLHISRQLLQKNTRYFKAGCQYITIYSDIENFLLFGCNDGFSTSDLYNLMKLRNREDTHLFAFSFIVYVKPKTIYNTNGTSFVPIITNMFRLVISETRSQTSFVFVDPRDYYTQ
ncbi:hypothetical protein CDIK_1416 [Cucumispora dikerogammari]|nr:hypothetical protein CDIK_1416 [Cucumispora dikerogammari]